MKLHIAALALPLVMLTAVPAEAADALGSYQIESVTARADLPGQLDGVKLYFGAQGHPSGRKIDSNVPTSVRTRKFGRSNEESCQWVMMSALANLAKHAKAVGGNAVVNIRSNWQNVETSSTKEYKCSVGFLMAGVALKGDVISTR